MDPNQNCRWIAEALLDGNRQFAYESLDELITWLDKGGYPPDNKHLAMMLKYLSNDRKP